LNIYNPIYRLVARTVNARASCAEGLELKSRIGQTSRTGQILHSVANGSPPLQHLRKSCVALVLWRGDGHRKLVTRFGVIQRVYWKVWFY